MRKAVGLMLGVCLVGMLVIGATEQPKEPCPSDLERLCLPSAELEVESMENAFGEVMSFFSTFITELKCSFAVLSERSQALEQRYKTLQQGMDGFEIELEGLTGRVEALEAIALPAIEDHEQRISALEREDLGALQRKVLALQQDIQALQVKLDNTRAKLEGFESAVAGFSGELQGCRASIAGLEEQAQAQAESIDAMSAELQRLADDQAAQWSAIILVPLVMGGVLYFLITQGG
ncbi:MAG: hypothetical protein ACP5G2_01595 [Candidatus Bipolaricaulaceae bacterium]